MYSHILYQTKFLFAFSYLVSHGSPVKAYWILDRVVLSLNPIADLSLCNSHEQGKFTHSCSRLTQPSQPPSGRQQRGAVSSKSVSAHPSACQSNTNMMTITAKEAITSSNRKKLFEKQLHETLMA